MAAGSAAVGRARPVTLRPTQHRYQRSGSQLNRSLPRVGRTVLPFAAMTIVLCFMTTWTSATPPPVCGDGVVDPGEQCDDNNVVDSDGCSSLCQTGQGIQCIGAPSVCSCQVDFYPIAPGRCGFCTAAATCSNAGSCFSDATCNCDPGRILSDCSGQEKMVGQFSVDAEVSEGFANWTFGRGESSYCVARAAQLKRGDGANGKVKLTATVWPADAFSVYDKLQPHLTIAGDVVEFTSDVPMEFFEPLECVLKYYTTFNLPTPTQSLRIHAFARAERMWREIPTDGGGGVDRASVRIMGLFPTLGAYAPLNNTMGGSSLVWVPPAERIPFDPVAIAFICIGIVGVCIIVGLILMCVRRAIRNERRRRAKRVEEKLKEEEKREAAQQAAAQKLAAPKKLSKHEAKVQQMLSKTTFGGWGQYDRPVTMEEITNLMQKETDKNRMKRIEASWIADPDDIVVGRPDERDIKGPDPIDIKALREAQALKIRFDQAHEETKGDGPFDLDENGIPNGVTKAATVAVAVVAMPFLAAGAVVAGGVKAVGGAIASALPDTPETQKGELLIVDPTSSTVGDGEMTKQLPGGLDAGPDAVMDDAAPWDSSDAAGYDQYIDNENLAPLHGKRTVRMANDLDRATQSSFMGGVPTSSYADAVEAYERDGVLPSEGFPEPPTPQQHQHNHGPVVGRAGRWVPANPPTVPSEVATVHADPTDGRVGAVDQPPVNRKLFTLGDAVLPGTGWGALPPTANLNTAFPLSPLLPPDWTAPTNQVTVTQRPTIDTFRKASPQTWVDWPPNKGTATDNGFQDPSALTGFGNGGGVGQGQDNLYRVRSPQPAQAIDDHIRGMYDAGLRGLSVPVTGHGGDDSMDVDSNGDSHRYDHDRHGDNAVVEFDHSDPGKRSTWRGNIASTFGGIWNKLTPNKANVSPRSTAYVSNVDGGGGGGGGGGSHARSHGGGWATDRNETSQVVGEIGFVNDDATAMGWRAAPMPAPMPAMATPTASTVVDDLGQDRIHRTGMSDVMTPPVYHGTIGGLESVNESIRRLTYAEAYLSPPPPLPSLPGSHPPLLAPLTQGRPIGTTAATGAPPATTATSHPWVGHASASLSPPPAGGGGTTTTMTPDYKTNDSDVHDVHVTPITNTTTTAIGTPRVAAIVAAMQAASAKKPPLTTPSPGDSGSTAAARAMATRVQQHKVAAAASANKSHAPRSPLPPLPEERDGTTSNGIDIYARSSILSPTKDGVRGALLAAAQAGKKTSPAHPIGGSNKTAPWAQQSMLRPVIVDIHEEVEDDVNKVIVNDDFALLGMKGVSGAEALDFHWNADDDVGDDDDDDGDYVATLAGSHGNGGGSAQDSAQDPNDNEAVWMYS